MINEWNCYAYCCEDLNLIENYDEAVNSPEMWDCHHRLEIQDDGTRLSREDLKKMNRFFNQKADDLIFLSHSDHAALHMSGNKFNKGKRHTEEWKQQMSELTKERFKNPELRERISNKMKNICKSEETKKRMSEASKKRWAIAKSKGLNSLKNQTTD